MATNNPGAVRAAALLRVLSAHARPVSFTTCCDEMESVGVDDVPRTGRSAEQLLRRAVADLATWGVDARFVTRPDGERMVELVTDHRPLGDRQRLSLSPAETRMRRSGATALRLLDPDHLVDEATLVKVHIPQDVIELTYGESGVLYTGVLYTYVHGDRPVVRVRTTDGDRGFYVDAIRTIMLVRRGDSVPHSDAEVPVIDAEPVGNRAWLRRQGRPGDFRTLREAQRVAAAVHGAARGVTNSPVPYELIAERAQMTMTAINELAAIVEQVDPTILFGERLHSRSAGFH